MKVRWEDIPPEGRRISLGGLTPFDLHDPAGGVTLASAPEGEIVLRRTPQGIEVQGAFKGGVVLSCARCLKDCTVAIAAEFKEYFLLPRYAPSDEDLELSPEDLDISFMDADEIDLIDIVEEQIWLNIPMKPLCAEGCRGLCSICGMDLNSGECGCERGELDPRFAVLQGYRSRLMKGGR